MCGIAGFYGKGCLSLDTIERTLQLMKRRGPDHQSFYLKNSGEHTIALLHSRLAIIDLETRSNQPFRINNDIIVFNGEIYNYQEIKKKLLQQGESFLTESDTEVLLRWYKVTGGGEKFFDELEGMWSFALFNEDTQNLLLSRDRFGEKPLYFLRTASGVYFASEPKMIRELSGVDFSIDQGRIKRFLVQGHRSLFKTNTSFFCNLEILDAGSSLSIDRDGRITTNRYWQPKISINTSMTIDEAVEGVRTRFIDSLRLRTRADVPLAFCLSGGVDSGAIASVAAKSLNCQVKSFSIIDPHAYYNESVNIGLTVRDIGSEHSEILLTQQDFFAHMRSLVGYHESPISTISYYIHSLLSQTISERGFRVVFSGTGADELFTGYYDHYLLHLLELKGTADYEPALQSWRTHVEKFVRNPILKDLDYFRELQSVGDYLYADSSIGIRYLQDLFVDPFFQQEYSTQPLRNRMLNELFHEIIPVILHEDDLNSMYYSIENRSPFLDRKLFEFSTTIPSQHLIQNGFTKYPLRMAMKGILNDTVRLDRKKVGFNASFDSLVDRKSKQFVDQVLAENSLYDIVSRDEIEKLIRKEEVSVGEGMFLFRFIGCLLMYEKSVLT